MSLQTINSTINAGIEDYKGKVLKGVVVDNNDPRGMGRIKVRVADLYEPDQGELPWVGPSKESPFGIGPTWGTYGSPWPGSEVGISLQDGDPHHPMYDFDLLSAANVDPDFASPDVWGYKDPVGNRLRVDMGSNTWSFRTGTGYTLDVDSSGNLKVHVPGNAEFDAGGNVSIKAGGNIALEASGTASYKASVHQFQGPIVADSTIVAGGDITDSTASGNTRTMANMRQTYDVHNHQYWDDGSEQTTSIPNQQT